MDIDIQDIQLYKHYIETDENGYIIDCFTSADRYKRKSKTKIEVGQGRRQFDCSVFPDFTGDLIDLSTGIPLYKYKNGKIVKTEKSLIEEERNKAIQKENKRIKKEQLKEQLLENLLAGEKIDSIVEQYKSEILNIKSK